MTTQEFLGLFPLSISNNIYRFSQKRKIDHTEFTPPFSWKALPNLYQIAKFNDPFIGKSVIENECQFHRFFEQNVLLTEWLPDTLKRWLLNHAIFFEILLVLCTPEQITTLSRSFLLDRQGASEHDIIDTGYNYTEYKENTVEFLRLYKEKQDELFSSASFKQRHFTAMIEYLSVIYNLVSTYNLAFVKKIVSLVKPPAYLCKRLKFRISILYLIPGITPEVDILLPKHLMLKNVDKDLLFTPLKNQLTYADYQELIAYVPPLSKMNKSGRKLLTEFSNMLYGKNKKDPFFNNLRSKCVPGETFYPINNRFQEDLPRQLVTYLLPKWTQFWRRNKWSCSIEIQKRLHYLKQIKGWIPDTNLLIKMLLSYN